MQCPNCSTELPDSAKFCLECGRDLRGRSEFASPVAYTPKHLAERILTSRAALEAVRMGLNTGLVVVGSIGHNLRMDYTAVGDTTNVAARLQQAAAPGEILISEATARLVRGELRLLPAGALTVKGKSDPVTAYKVVGVAPRQSAFEHAAECAFGRFVGRESELRRLGELLAEAQSGGGRLVSVIGDAGS